MFLQYKVTKEVAEILTRLVTCKNHLPQGAPTSTYIGLLVLQPVVQKVEKILKKIPKSSFSVYVDDIIISGPEGIKRLIPILRKVLKRYRFEINDKTNIMNWNTEQVCLNIRLNNRIEPPKSYLQEIKDLAKKVPASDPGLRGKRAYANFLLKN
jgi:RNA-directed DNA polymerase